MKSFTIVLAALVFSAIVFGNSIAVSPMKKLPRKVISFANDLYAEVVIDKDLVQQFLDEGAPKQRLSEEQKKYDEEANIRNPVGKNADGMLLHGCNGVFTDESGLVYFWVLSSPRVLDITSQKYETTFLVLKKAPERLIKALGLGANQAPEPTPTTVTPPAGQEARQP
jgi:hypothetical protein